MNADLTALIFSRCPHAHLEECGKRGGGEKPEKSPSSGLVCKRNGGRPRGRAPSVSARAPPPSGGEMFSVTPASTL